MGNSCVKHFEDDETNSQITRLHLLMVLHEEGAAEVLNFALQDRQNYEICKNEEELRQACILAASRKYYFEKFRYEDVYKKTAPYVLLLKEFMQIQDALEEEKQMEEGHFDHFSSLRRRNKHESERNQGRTVSF